MRVRLNVFKCLFCDKPLTGKLLSNEHIIPNALGGRLQTPQASCIDRNSKIANEIEQALIRPLSLWANAFDVVRDRGEHPHHYFENDEHQFVLEPGQNVKSAPNFKIKKNSDGTFSVNVSAPTQQEAQRLVEKYMRKSIEVRNWKPEPEDRTFQFETSLNYSDPAVLRAAAKIALNFCRSLGVQTSPHWASQAFLTSGKVSSVPVSPVRQDIVDIGDRENSLSHCVALFSRAAGAPLFCYVRLFQAFEFLVLVTEKASASIQRSYYVDLIAGTQEARAFSLTLGDDELMKMLEIKELSAERFRETGASMAYWFQNRSLIWIDRAMAAGANALAKELERGANDDQAKSIAHTAASKILARYGLSDTAIKFTLNRGATDADPNLKHQADRTAADEPARGSGGCEDASVCQRAALHGRADVDDRGAAKDSGATLNKMAPLCSRIKAGLIG